MNVYKLAKLNKYSLLLTKCFYKIHFYLIGRLIAKNRINRTAKNLISVAPDLFNKKYNLETTVVINSPIFVMWLQGEQSMPEVIQLCYKSIKTNIKNHPVILITEENISEYLDLPEYIYQKLEKGIISRTHFSDLVRSGLLAKFGGTWIDSSVFISNKISEEYFNQNFYCPCGFKSELRKEWKYIFNKTNGWTIWFLGSCQKDFPLFKFLYEYQLKYWESNNVLLDYFQTDILIYLFSKFNSEFYNLLQNLKVNNSNPYSLYTKLNSFYNDVIMDKNQFVHKFTYKHKLEKSINNQNTLYGNLVLKYINQE